MKLLDAVVAVTGGASGLGAAAAQLCVEKGAKVAVLDMNKDLLIVLLCVFLVKKKEKEKT